MLRKETFRKILFATVLFWLFVLLITLLKTTTSYTEIIKKKFEDVIPYQQNNDTAKPDVKNLFKLEKKLEDDFAKETALYRARVDIRTGLANYNFSKIPGVKSITDLIPEDGGNPVRSMVVSTWRSGSTFLGEILESAPGTFYNYEPLLFLHKIQIRGPPQSTGAVHTLKKIFKCDFSDMDDYFTYSNENHYIFECNSRLWEHCKSFNEHCLDPKFTGQFCSLFPFQSMKTVRIRLQALEELLKDPELNIKMILLIRDPRATLSSRHDLSFCKTFPDCIEPSHLCGDMVSDYKAATRLIKEYPDRLTVVRYEDLVLNTTVEVERLFNFIQIGYMPEVEKHVKKHTTTDIAGGPFSTYKVSNDNAFSWKFNMDYDYVAQIQSECKAAMDYWGYVRAENKSHLRSTNFLPITDFNL